jgi:hypothetical protein
LIVLIVAFYTGGVAGKTNTYFIMTNKRRYRFRRSVLTRLAMTRKYVTEYRVSSQADEIR